jgi:hypothetical protein
MSEEQRNHPWTDEDKAIYDAVEAILNDEDVYDVAQEIVMAIRKLRKEQDQ